MTTYHVEVKSGNKGTAAEHCRYDARIGKYEKERDLLHFEFANMPDWSAEHPLPFWRAADKHERANAAAYREYIIALPNTLTLEQNIALVREMCEAIAGPRPWQVAIHGPEAKLGEVHNPHAHLMLSDRAPDGVPRSAEQYFSRYNPKHPERGGCRKLSGGLTLQEMREELTGTRKTVADLQNAALEKAGVDSRVDHRSFRDRGIDHAPESHLGPARVNRMTRRERREYVDKRSERGLAGSLHPGVPSAASRQAPGRALQSQNLPNS